MQSFEGEGVIFGKYKVFAKLAVGGMAELFLAKQPGPAGVSKTVVLKCILPHLAQQQEFVEMFLDEARISAPLNHPNIVQIYEIGEHLGIYYIAMEYIRGHNLREFRKRLYRKMPDVEPYYICASIIAQAAAGLHYAHTAVDDDGNPLNIIHRDISPTNLLLSYQGVTKIVDFGVAKATTQQHYTSAGTIKGKYRYMSPEQIQGLPLDHRSDIFSLGIVLYELTTNVPLFGRKNEAEIIEAVKNANVPSPRSYRPDYPEELEKIVMKALALNPDDRYQTADEFRADLEEFVKSSGNYYGSSQLSQLVKQLFSKEYEQNRTGANLIPLSPTDYVRFMGQVPPQGQQPYPPGLPGPYQSSYHSTSHTGGHPHHSGQWHFSQSHHHYSHHPPSGVMPPAPPHLSGNFPPIDPRQPYPPGQSGSISQQRPSPSMGGQKPTMSPPSPDRGEWPSYNSGSYEGKSGGSSINRHHLSNQQYHLSQGHQHHSQSGKFSVPETPQFPIDSKALEGNAVKETHSELEQLLAPDKRGEETFPSQDRRARKAPLAIYISITLVVTALLSYFGFKYYKNYLAQRERDRKLREIVSLVKEGKFSEAMGALKHLPEADGDDRPAKLREKIFQLWLKKAQRELRAKNYAQSRKIALEILNHRPNWQSVRELLKEIRKAKEESSRQESKETPQKVAPDKGEKSKDSKEKSEQKAADKKPKKKGKFYSLLVIYSRPRGSEVYLDSLPAGKTPFRKRLKSGLYLIEIKKNGYRAWSKEIELHPRRRTTLRVRLKKKPKQPPKEQVAAKDSLSRQKGDSDRDRDSGQTTLQPPTPPSPPKIASEKGGAQSPTPKPTPDKPPAPKSQRGSDRGTGVDRNTVVTPPPTPKPAGGLARTEQKPPAPSKPTWKPQLLNLPKKQRIRVFLIDPRGIAGLQYTLDLLRLSQKIERGLEKMMGPKYKVRGVTKAWRAFIREQAKATNRAFWTVYPRAVAYIIFRQLLRGRSLKRISQILVKYERLNRFKRYINK